MKLEETIVNLEKLIALFHAASEQNKMVDYSKIIETLEFALTALHPVSREQVRRGTIIETIKDGRANRVFSCCGHDFTELTCWFMPDFCPSCGAPMTDEAVEVMMERWKEALENG